MSADGRGKFPTYPVDTSDLPADTGFTNEFAILQPNATTKEFIHGV